MTIYGARVADGSDRARRKKDDPLRVYEGKVAASDGAVYAWFREPSGSGRSRLEIRINQDSFSELAQAMMRADPTAAIKAFGAAMQTVEIAERAPEASAA